MERTHDHPARRRDRSGHVVTELGGRVAAIHEAIRRAADPDVRPVWDKIQQERRIGAAHVVDDTASKGPLRRGIDEQAAADVVWVTSLQRELLGDQRGPKGSTGHRNVCPVRKSVA